MPYVYVLESKKDGKRYVGMSDRPEERLSEHNAGKTKSTEGHRPWILLHKEYYSNRRVAREREKYYKTAAGRRYLKKLLDL
jgi:putative endonuclease